MNKDLIIDLSLILLVLIIPTILILVGQYLFDKYITCPRFAHAVNLPYKYDWIAGGCFIQYNGQWIPSDNFGGVKINK